MRNITALFKRNAGFTLVELLVVIGILGILVAALIAAIDPIEQLRKASDTGTKTAISQFNDSVARYYANHSTLPWGAGGDAGCTTQAGGTAFNGKTLTSLINCLTAIVSDGELKASYTSNTSVLSKIIVSGSTSGVVSCFDPQSKQGKADPLTKFDTAGVSGVVATSYCLR